MNEVILRVRHLARNPYLPVAGICVLCMLICYVMIAVTYTPPKFDLKAGDIAKATITATKDIVDKLTTQSEREKAIARVEKRVERDPAISADVMSSVRKTLSLIQDKHAETEALIGPLRTQVNASDFAATALSMLGTATLERIGGELDISLDRAMVDALFLAETSDVLAMASALEYGMQKVLDQGVQDETRAASLLTVEEQFTLRPAQSLPDELKDIGMTIADQLLKANTHINMTQYDKDVAAATESITPVTYKQGEAIVREGGRVTEAQHAVMLELGLLAEHTDLSVYIGIAGLLALLFTVIAAYFGVFERQLLRSVKHTALVAIIIVVTLGVAIAVKSISVWLVPFELGSLLIALLIKPRVSIMVNFVLSVLLSIVTISSGQLLSPAMFSAALVGLIGGTHAVYMVRRSYQRVALVFSGVIIGVSNMAVVLCIGLMTTSRMTDLFIDAAWAFGAGVLSSILALGLAPLFESVFSLLTPSKLLELSNPNQPLLRRMLLEAPGTYHHSILVANLAESAVEEVGGNDLLARVGAYYHDVGKLKRPIYFGENQMGMANPHDKIEPEVSSSILRAHPVDGVTLAMREKLPKPILDIIEQHHGDSLTGYFYTKAVAAKGDDNVNPADYRYAGPKPQTVEAAVVMLADTVEAAVRSLQGPTHEKIQAFVHKLMRAKLEDGQLDDAPLTLKDLGKIQDAFCAVLKGVYHERIEYPEAPIKLEAPEKRRLK